MSERDEPAIGNFYHGHRHCIIDNAMAPAPSSAVADVLAEGGFATLLLDLVARVNAPTRTSWA